MGQFQDKCRCCLTKFEEKSQNIVEDCTENNKITITNKGKENNSSFKVDSKDIDNLVVKSSSKFYTNRKKANEPSTLLVPVSVIKTKVAHSDRYKFKSNTNIISLPNELQTDRLRISQKTRARSNSLKSPRLVSFFKLTKFLGIAKGYLYRRKFPSIRQALIQSEIKMIEELVEKLTTANIKKAEMLVSKVFQKDGWRKFYPDNKACEIEYGRVYKSNLKIFNSTDYYIGTVNLDGERHGNGICLTTNGCKYEGSWVKNKFTGWGRYIDIDGNLYEGNFIEGVLNGWGEKRTLNNTIYIGEFKNMMKDGFGKEETKDQYYEGEFKLDKKESKGKLQYKNKQDVYEGELKDNSLTGYGFYLWANKESYEGTFLNGKMHGRGVYKWPDGGEYSGDYVNNVKEGRGKFKFANGKIYVGPFKGGKPHGVGKLHYNDKVVNIEFNEGVLKNSNCIDNPNKSHSLKFK